MRRALASVLVAALAAGGMAGCGSGTAQHAPRATLPADFAGIVTEDAFAKPGPYRVAQLERQARYGIGIVRQTFSWKDIEKRPGRYDTRFYDQFVLDAARAGLTVLPILFDPPSFRAPPPVGRATSPPRDPKTMARFAAAMVGRYGPGGSLWRENPGVAPHPITSWQVWNEPNLPVYWAMHPDAAQYTRLLKVVGAAIKRADPRAEVVTAGLPQSKLGVSFETFLKGMYRAGAQGAFDVLAINAYSRRVTGMLAAVAGARRITASAEDGLVPIWVTEFGWATRPGPGSKMTVGPRTQARLLRTAIKDLALERRRLRIRGIVYYAWKDAKPYPGGEDFWGLHTGLLTRSGKAKPALRSLRVGIARARADYR